MDIIILNFLIKNCDFPISYVSLPEGIFYKLEDKSQCWKVVVSNFRSLKACLILAASLRVVAFTKILLGFMVIRCTNYCYSYSTLW